MGPHSTARGKVISPETPGGAAKPTQSSEPFHRFIFLSVSAQGEQQCFLMKSRSPKASSEEQALKRGPAERQFEMVSLREGGKPTAQPASL